MYSDLNLEKCFYLGSSPEAVALGFAASRFTPCARETTLLEANPLVVSTTILNETALGPSVFFRSMMMSSDRLLSNEFCLMTERGSGRCGLLTRQMFTCRSERSSRESVHHAPIPVEARRPFAFAFRPSSFNPENPTELPFSSVQESYE